MFHVPYKVIGIEKDSLIVKVILHAGKRMHYHSHEKRDEVWVVIGGEGPDDSMIQQMVL